LTSLIPVYVFSFEKVKKKSHFLNNIYFELLYLWKIHH